MLKQIRSISFKYDCFLAFLSEIATSLLFKASKVCLRLQKETKAHLKHHPWRIPENNEQWQCDKVGLVQAQKWHKV